MEGDKVREAMQSQCNVGEGEQSQSLGRKQCGQTFALGGLILFALLRKDSRGTRVEIRRSVGGYFNNTDADDGVWTKVVVVEVVTNSWILGTFCKLCQQDFTRDQM